MGSNLKMTFFSIIIPAHNEEGNIEKTCQSILKEFGKHNITDFEILVVNDNSQDKTEEKLKVLTSNSKYIRYINNIPPNGFGFAVRKGLDHYTGEVACLVMADSSDYPKDILKYYSLMKEGHPCVFGSRFIQGSKVVDYPKFKLIINRFANWFIKTLFCLDHNDITNAFKCYRREVIDALQPILSHHFNLTVELPLKAIVRGFSYVTLPISWRNREEGCSKLRLKEMGSRYFKVIFVVFLEKLQSKNLKLR